MVAKKKAQQDGASDEEFSDEASLVSIDDDNVHGIQEIEIQHGEPGYLKVTTGWLVVCIGVFLLQVLIILILIQGAKDAGDGCMSHPLVKYSYTWWLLHLSKAAAIGTAGLLMSQEIMDTLNYAMVSRLVESEINIEVCIIASCRMALSALIAVANVIIFSYLKYPATVWINMTALAFIGELGTGMLDVARRGVFGHHVMKVMTDVNFELTFVHEYPWWFPHARSTAITVSACFVAVFASIAFAAPDIVCHHEMHSNGTHPHMIFHHISQIGTGGAGAHVHHR